MGRVWFLRTVLLLFALPGGWFKPVITPNATHLVIPKGGQLELSCHDDAEMSKVRWMREKNRKIDGGLKEDGASVILLSSTQIQHMGRYTCENTQTEEKSSIYIYVKDSENPFVRSMLDGLLVREGENGTLACLVTDPAVTHLSLLPCTGSALPAGLTYIADPQKGITIRNVSKAFEGCYICAGEMDEKPVKSSQYNLVVRLGMYVSNRSQNSNILPGSREYKLSTGLSIESVKMTDSGVYRCVARNEKGVSTAPVNLEVYEHGFINLTEGEDSVMEVREGESLTLSVEMTSYPRPTKVYWTYNNQQLKNTSEHVITLHNQQYRYIELRLVRVHESEGGIYTFSAYHMYASVNRSFTVHVICKPVIVSQEGPVDGQVRCVASGYPVPKISWYYCEPPHARYDSQTTISHSHSTTVQYCVSLTYCMLCKYQSKQTIRTVPHKLFTPLLSCVVSTAVLLSFFLVVLLYKYMQKPKYEIHWKVIDSFDGNNYTYIDPTQLPYDPKWEFPRERLRFGKILGSGAFGKVVAATAYGLCSADTVTTVAVKMLKPSAHSTEKEALMSELKVLSFIGNHINIVNLLGACTVGGPTLVITEYCCYGDLLNFLRRKRDAFFSSKTGDGYYKNLLKGTDNGYMPMSYFYHQHPLFNAFQSVSLYLSEWCDDKDDLSLDTEDLLSFSYQVAKGMDFLTSKNCIHRDLAARNVLLTQGRVAKICDFGLARDITRDSSYVLRGNARLPVKWMSPESLFACVYTFESDVWSYGILLWEIFSLGNTPYPGIPVGSTFYKMIQDGYRMSEPEFAPSEVYEVMRWCWSADPLKRPTFKKLVERTEHLLSEITKRDYLNLSTSGSCEVFVPPDLQRAQRLSSVGSSTASTQPLLQATNDVFLEHQSI
uniref:receptor protein-tyrosine kinase n=1 Tax=Cyprinus carpio TaxID=7962 RepID=A0A8C2E9V0_CYPCA